MSEQQKVFMPVDAATGEPLKLALQTLWLSGEVLPVGARLMVRHEFVSAESRPLEVVYSFGLPRDAALRRFEVSGEGFTVHSELKRVADAVAQYEQGVAAGSLSTMARQYRDGMVNLTLGNLRPGERVTVALELLAGVDLRDQGLRFRFPFTLAPAYHAQARSIERESGVGEIELPAEEFGDVLLPPFVKDADGLHKVGFDLSVQLPAAIREVSSPSHAMRMTRLDDQHYRVSSAQGDLPNRDLVLDVLTDGDLCGVVCSEQTPHFAAVIPSTRFGKAEHGPRRIVFVVDRSSSMQGAPMAQAKKAVDACLATLSPADQFGIVAFDNVCDTLHTKLLSGDVENRDRARKFLATITARGGTELASGCGHAAALLGSGGGDLLVLTDGQVAGTEDILSQVRGAAVRLHTLGIGSASQDRFLTLLARETGGTSRFVTPQERVDMAAVELFSSIGRPVASGIRISGPRVQPEPAPYVHAGTPLVLFGECEQSQTWSITWDGASQPLELPLRRSAHQPAQKASDETIRLLQGARLITDLDARLAGPFESSKLGDRERKRMELALEKLSETYGLASRVMALVAVIARPGDRVGDLPKTEVVPVGMPGDVAFDAYFGGSMAVAASIAASLEVMPLIKLGRTPDTSASSTIRYDQRLVRRHASPAGTPETFKGKRAAPAERFDFLEDDAAAPRVSSFDDILIELACRLEPDGGMRGKDDAQRLLHTLVALAAMVSAGHTIASGALRSHVTRLVDYLGSLKLSDHAEIVGGLLDCARSGRQIRGDFLGHARLLCEGKPLDASAVWQDLTLALEPARTAPVDVR